MVGLLLLSSCVEYRFTPEPKPTHPDIAVSPSPLTRTGACDTEAADLTVTNEGDGPLTLTSLTVEGGVDVTETPLPVEIAPGASRVLSLTIEPGVGLVLLGSDDPDEPLVSVPISAEGNEHPVVAILAPYEDQWVPAEGPFTLAAIVEDAEDAAPTLALQWTSTLSGIVGAATADADGFVRTEWPADARVSGPQTISLTATDACGAVGEATLFYCQEGPFTWEALVADAWHTEGGAVVDPAAGTLVLGEAGAVGAAFDAFALVNAEAVEASFRVRTTGDVRGFSLTALDGDGASAGWIGGDGCGLGFGGGAACTGGPALPGWSLAFAAGNGEGCLAEDHVAWTFDGDVAAWAACAPGGVADGAWHDVRVAVAAPRVTVTVDGDVTLDATLDEAWSFSAFLGFTAVTDGGVVEIEDLWVTDAVCRQ